MPVKPITSTGVVAKKKICFCENTVPEPNKLSYFTRKKEGKLALGFSWDNLDDQTSEIHGVFFKNRCTNQESTVTPQPEYTFARLVNRIIIINSIIIIYNLECLQK